MRGRESEGKGGREGGIKEDKGGISRREERREKERGM